MFRCAKLHGTCKDRCKRSREKDGELSARRQKFEDEELQPAEPKRKLEGELCIQLGVTRRGISVRVHKAGKDFSKGKRLIFTICNNTVPSL